MKKYFISNFLKKLFGGYSGVTQHSLCVLLDPHAHSSSDTHAHFSSAFDSTNINHNVIEPMIAY